MLEMTGNVQAGAVHDRIHGFIVTNFLFGDEAAAPAGDDSLLGRGIVDSTGILELIEYLESEFGITVAEVETTPDNLDSVDRLAAFVARKAAA